MQEVQRSAAPLRPREIQLALPEPVGELSVAEDVHSAGPGGCVWDASLALAHYVATELCREGGLRGSRVVELGAGTGVPGLAAAKLGADVVVTDRARALPLLRRNVDANGVVAQVLELEWGQRLPAELEDALPRIVLGADLVAHEEAFEPLLQTLSLLTQADGSAIYMACKCRDASEHRFWETAQELFYVETLQCGLSAVNRDGDELPITLYRLLPRPRDGT